MSPKAKGRTPSRTVKRPDLLVMGLLAVLSASAYAAPPTQRGPRDLGRGASPLTVPEIQEMIQGFYVSRFQQELTLDDEQFVELLPALRDSLEQRNRLGQEHSQALNALRRALQDGASDDEFIRLIEDVDNTERQLRDVQEELLREVDPTLTPEQRARFRIVQPNVENRIRNLIERSRNAFAPGNAPPQPQ